MRPQKVHDDELLSGLMSVLRAKGYEGASLNDLAHSSGLQKASLYHRFPGGKKDIGLAVLKFVEDWKEKNITAVVKDKSSKPEEKLMVILANIKAIYAGGETSCIMKAMSMGDGLDLFNDELKLAAEKWLDVLAELAMDFGSSRSVAEQKAMQSLVKIQGSLIVSKNLKNTQPFIDALKEIEILYKNN